MAALSTRPSLRSSNRNNPILNQVLLPLPPADQNPPANSRRGKHTRDSSLADQSNPSIKRLRFSLPDPTPSNDASKTCTSKSLPIRDRSAPDHPPHETKSPKSDSPQPSNGTTIAVHNLQSFNSNATITVNTKDTSSKNDKRSLRSHDGCSRSKSELALYIPNYDELLSIEPKEPEFLTPETLIYITDDPAKGTPSTLHFKNANDTIQEHTNGVVNGSSQALKLSEETFTTLNDATRLDLSAMDKRNSTRDPMTDAVYLKAHRRAERQEKRLRNIEKERAMHEKFQLERLLDGLKGHEWLRVMGISGITDGEKKAYEPKRDYFIKYVLVLLDKFREWKEEEKRRVVGKEESMVDEEEEQEDDGSEENDGSDDDLPESNAAEAASTHSRKEVSSTTKAPPGKRQHSVKAPSAPPPQKPFTSFYSKPYLREAAIGKHRRGRARFAFGQPLPEPAEQDFGLPEDILSPEAIEGVRRSRRAKRRRSNDD